MRAGVAGPKQEPWVDDGLRGYRDFGLEVRATSKRVRVRAGSENPICDVGEMFQAKRKRDDGEDGGVGRSDDVRDDGLYHLLSAGGVVREDVREADGDGFRRDHDGDMPF